jgi:hypothetical protein
VNRWGAIAALMTAVLLAGCQMLDSRWLDSDPAVDATCHSNAGTYHLPRRLITVVVRGSDQAGFALEVTKSGTAAPYVADRSETYCLDFLLSGLSADRVGIQRTANGLLQRVFTQADDKTKQIAQDIIQAAADLIASDRADTLARGASRPQFNENKTANILASYQFDPFVEREARQVNEALSEFGYCIYLEGRNDPFVPGWSEDICRRIAASRAKRSARAREDRESVAHYKAYPRSGLPGFDPRPIPRHVQERGILYRPELAHTLIVIRKPDPGSRFSEWDRVGSDRIVVPNAAPAFILEVKRAIFVKAETDVQFFNGLIKNVSVNKPSELLAAADLAVAAAQIVTNIPAQALKVFNNRVENTRELMATNAALIELLRNQRDDLDSEAYAQAVAQAKAGTSLVLGNGAPDLGLSPGRTLNAAGNPQASRFAECISDPSVQQYPDPVRTCQELVKQGR